MDPAQLTPQCIHSITSRASEILKAGFPERFMAMVRIIVEASAQGHEEKDDLLKPRIAELHAAAIASAVLQAIKESGILLKE